MTGNLSRSTFIAANVGRLFAFLLIFAGVVGLQRIIHILRCRADDRAHAAYRLRKAAAEADIDAVMDACYPLPEAVDWDAEWRAYNEPVDYWPGIAQYPRRRACGNTPYLRRPQ